MKMRNFIRYDIAIVDKSRHKNLAKTRALKNCY